MSALLKIKIFEQYYYGQTQMCVRVCVYISPYMCMFQLCISSARVDVTCVCVCVCQIFVPQFFFMHKRTQLNTELSPLLYKSAHTIVLLRKIEPHQTSKYMDASYYVHEQLLSEFCLSTSKYFVVEGQSTNSA